MYSKASIILGAATLLLGCQAPQLDKSSSLNNYNLAHSHIKDIRTTGIADVLPLRIILLGAPGVGKGTQAQLLAQKYDIPSISTGDILREVSQLDSELGHKVKETMARGELVDDATINVVLADRLAQCSKGFILDGFPRTVTQAKALEDLMAKLSKGITIVLDYRLNDMEIMQRIRTRAICAKCNSGEIAKANPLCNKCSGLETNRADDNENTVKERIKQYRNITAPLSLFYQERRPSNMFIIDAGQDPEQIFASTSQRINELRRSSAPIVLQR